MEDHAEGGAFQWGVNGDNEDSCCDDAVADELVEHVEAVMQHVGRSMGSFLGFQELRPDAAEVALAMLTGELPARGEPRGWDAIVAVVRPLVVRRVGG